MRYFSLFTGIGGFELGIKQAYEYISKTKRGKQGRDEGRENNANDKQFKLSSQQPTCVGFSEIDKYAVQTYQKHFPNHKNYGDITKIDEHGLPDFELLCGGFPCQSFSIAGKRGGFEDTRGTLFFHIARIAKVKRPRFLFLENVKGLLSHDGGRTFNTIIAVLDELGYDLQWQVLNSKNFGVPQNRERVFIIGHLREVSRPQVFPFNGGDQENGKERVLAHTLNASDWRGANRNQQQTTIQQLNNPTHSNDRIYDTEGIAPTLNTAQGGNRQPKIGVDIANAVTPDAYLATGDRKRVDGKAVLTSMHERRIRRLTPVECERLQGFPDGWTEGVSDTQRYKTLGNAVTVNVIQAIAERLL